VWTLDTVESVMMDFQLGLARDLVLCASVDQKLGVQTNMLRFCQCFRALSTNEYLRWFEFSVSTALSNKSSSDFHFPSWNSEFSENSGSSP
jgi:hypothetical protein